MRLWLVTNHWGWGLRGIYTWIRYGWGCFPVWGVEVSGSVPQRFRWLTKLGPVCWEVRP